MISVIVPAYNEAQYLPKCLESLKNQQETPDFEIVIIDNNSTDNTNKIARDFGVVVEEKIQGLSVAKNTGARYAKGDILYFVDADCVVPLDQLNRISRFFSEHKNVAAVSGPIKYYDAGSFLKFFVNYLNYYNFYHNLLSKLAGFVSLTGGNMAVKSQVFQELEGFNKHLTDINSPEDLEFALRLKGKGYKADFSAKFTVESSCRRCGGLPKKGALIRFTNTVKILLSKNCK